MSIVSCDSGVRSLTLCVLRRRAAGLLSVAGLASCLGFASFEARAAQQWLTFQSTQHFSIEFPADWDHGPLKGDALGMYDVKHEGKKAVVIPDGHAFLSAVSEGDTPAEAIADAKRFQTEIKQVKKLPVSSQAGGCESLTQVDEREWTRYAEDLRLPRSAHAFIQNSVTYFCEARGRKSVTVSVNFWEGDKRETLYRDIVLHMAKSLRFTP